ncbi:MAG TPA: response regulator transcription factor [Bryobacteraceae bacterium]|nr:response regulator transcription factor [Bryobacteraceae bacterium]
MGRPTVILADDHAVLREGLVRILESAFDIVGAVGDGRTLVTETERLRPDVVVLDVGMPLLNGIEAATQIRNNVPAARLVFLSQQSGKEYVQAAFRLGAWGYVLKNAAAAELVSGIHEVLGGRRFLSAELRQRFGDPDPLSTGSAGEHLGNVLTPRQREVLQLVAEGKSAKEIAHLLKISVKTVEFHKASIMDELGLRTTAELTRYALQQGILAS